MFVKSARRWKNKTRPSGAAGTGRLTQGRV